MSLVSNIFSRVYKKNTFVHLLRVRTDIYVLGILYVHSWLLLKMEFIFPLILFLLDCELVHSAMCLIFCQFHPGKQCIRYFYYY